VVGVREGHDRDVGRELLLRRVQGHDLEGLAEFGEQELGRARLLVAALGRSRRDGQRADQRGNRSRVGRVAMRAVTSRWACRPTKS
jgi:hypothetical protein